jgi:hypothetical protein
VQPLRQALSSLLALTDQWAALLASRALGDVVERRCGAACGHQRCICSESVVQMCLLISV